MSNNFPFRAHLNRQITSVKVAPLTNVWVREVRLQRVGMRWVVVIRSPLVEVIGDIVSTSIGSGIFKVDDYILGLIKIAASCSPDGA